MNKAQSSPNPIQMNRALYVGSLPSNVTKGELQRYFSRFGEIAFVCLEMRSKNRNKGFGYILPAAEDVYLAILQLRHTINNKHIRVERFLNSNALSLKHIDLNERRAIVCNLKFYEWDSENFEKLMSQFGTIEKIYLNKNNALVTKTISGGVIYRDRSSLQNAKNSEVFYKLGLELRQIVKWPSPNHGNIFKKVVDNFSLQNNSRRNIQFDQSPQIDGHIRQAMPLRINQIERKFVRDLNSNIRQELVLDSERRVTKKLLKYSLKITSNHCLKNINFNKRSQTGYKRK